MNRLVEREAGLKKVELHWGVGLHSGKEACNLWNLERVLLLSPLTRAIPDKHDQIGWILQQNTRVAACVGSHMHYSG